jgi:pyruvate formate lyase activating enzyme
MQIAGLQKLTLLDFPSRTACTVFTPGCNFRCGYCHNPELVEPKNLELIDEGKFFDFLSTRKGLLDGVCVTGGEPTLQPDLLEFLKKIRQRGFLVKLDTNGSNPEVLEKLFRAHLLDYVALDVKASPERYEKLIKTEGVVAKIRAARDLIMQSGVEYEFRTTLVKELVSEKEWGSILNFVCGAEKFFLQNFENKTNCLDPQFRYYHGFLRKELEAMCAKARNYVRECGIRF